jgi:hypothetical protein
LDTKFNKLKNSESDEEEINEKIINNMEKSQNSNKRISYLLTNQQTEMISLIEAKNKLEKDNEIFERKIIHYENEIKTKYYLKSEFEIKVQMYETEKNLLLNKLKNIENRCEKLQKENLQLNTNKDNLLIEIELLQKKYNDILDKSNNNFNLDLSPSTNIKENMGNLHNILNEENFYENSKDYGYGYEEGFGVDLKRRVDNISKGLTSQFEGIGLLLDEKTVSNNNNFNNNYTNANANSITILNTNININTKQGK